LFRKNNRKLEVSTALTKAKSREHMGADLRGQPGHVPPIIEKRPCIYHFLPPFAPPNTLVCPPNIFDKSAPVRGNQLIQRRLSKTKSIGRRSKSIESGRQTAMQAAMVNGAWS